MEGLAIIDEQASLTFLDPKALERLQVPDSQLRPSALATSTIEGVSAKKPCKYLKDLQVSPIDGSRTINISSSVIRDELPDNIREVPDIGDVQSVPKFRKVAGHFPRKNNSWPTILLIGRDCMPAQK